MRPYLSLGEAAELYGVTPYWLHQQVTDRRIRFTMAEGRNGKRSLRFYRNQLEAFFGYDIALPPSVMTSDDARQCM
jgi:hypothetical protein